MADEMENPNDFGVPLGRTRPRWLCWVDAALVVKFGLTLMLVWVTLSVGGCGASFLHGVLRNWGFQDGPIRGFEVFLVSPWLWLIVPVAAVVAWRLRRPARRRTGLHQFGVAMFRTVVVLAMAAGALVTVLGNGTDPEIGWFLGLGALGLLAVVQIVCVVRNVAPMMDFLRYRKSLRRRNWWTLPGFIVNLLVTLGIWGAACYFSFRLYSESGDSPALMLLFIWPVFWTLLLLLAATAMWHRETWGSWTHLAVSAVPVLYVVFGILDKGFADPEATLLVLLVGALALAWWLGPFFAGYLTSAHRLQRRRCGGCGKNRWLRAGRCGVCGERLWIPKDGVSPPVCLACGNELPLSRPVCGGCGATDRHCLESGRAQAS